MNTGDLSSGDENSQSYNSDSSSIPSYLSDFEIDPSDEPPFSTQQSGFEGGFSLLLTCDRKSVLQPHTENGTILQPLPDRATPLSPFTVTHQHVVDKAPFFTSTSTQQHALNTAPLYTSTSNHHQAVDTAPLYTSTSASLFSSTSALYAYTSQIESIPPTEDLLLAVAPSHQVYIASDQTKQIAQSESNQSIAFIMSRTQPAKIRDKFQSQISSLISPPVSSVHERHYFSENIAGPSIKSDGIMPPLQQSTSEVIQPENVDNTIASHDGSQNKPKMPSASYTSKVLEAAGHKETPAAKLGSISTVGLAVTTGGYTSSEEDGIVRRPTIIKQSCTLQSHTAFPIPPPPEQAEALMRHMDNLNMPNVSPDSGIQSVESSPSGNDSPGSVISLAMNEPAQDHRCSALPGHSQVKQSFDVKFSMSHVQENMQQASSNLVYHPSNISSELMKGETSATASSIDKNTARENSRANNFSNIVLKENTQTLFLEAQESCTKGDSIEINVQKESGSVISNEKGVVKQKAKKNTEKKIKKDISRTKRDKILSNESLASSSKEDNSNGKDISRTKRDNDKILLNESVASSSKEDKITSNGKDIKKAISRTKRDKIFLKESLASSSKEDEQETNNTISMGKMVEESKESSTIGKTIEPESGETIEKSALKENSRTVGNHFITKPDTNLVLPDNLYLDLPMSDVPNPFKGPSMGRKKRGRPAKRKKSQMLQHKQSTLYKELYSSDTAVSNVRCAEQYSDKLNKNAERIVSVGKSVYKSVDNTETENRSASKDINGSGIKKDTDIKVDTVVCSEVNEVCEAGFSQSGSLVHTSVEKVLIIEADSSPQMQKRVFRKKNKTKKKLNRVKQSINERTEDSSAFAFGDSVLRRRGRPKGSKNKPKLGSHITDLENGTSKPVVSSEIVALESVTRESCDGKINPNEESPEVVDVIQSPAELVKVRSASLARKRANSSPKKNIQRPSNTTKRLGKMRFTMKTKGQVPSKTDLSLSQKRGRGRPRKKSLPLTEEVDVSGEALPVKTKAVADSELASLIQSVQNSIQSQFSAPDMEESNDFAMDSSDDISRIEPSLPQVKSSTPVKSLDNGMSKSPDTNIVKKVVSKYKKPKVHVMMRNTKRRKKKVQVRSPKPESSTSSEVLNTKEPIQRTSSFKDLSEQESVSSCSVVNIFGPSISKPVNFPQRYNSSKLLKQSTFRLQASALGNALQGGDDTSDDDHDGSEGRKKKKKKKLLYFKSKHRNIVDPVFMSEIQSLLCSMDNLAISEQAFLRVKPGEVPLPSIFKLTIIDVKKKKKDRLILEPMSFCDKSKKVKVRKDCKEGERSMPDLVKEKSKGRKKSPTEETAPPNLEIQFQSDHCLPPKKRHRLMYAAESTQEATSSSVDCCSEKRKFGRPRKSADSAIDTGESIKTDVIVIKDAQDKSSRVAQKRQNRSTSYASRDKSEESVCVLPRSSTNAATLLACPRHAHKSESVTSCAECNLLTQSQPAALPSKPIRQQPPRNLSPSSCMHVKLLATPLSHKNKVTMNRTQRRGSKSDIATQPLTVCVATTYSPRSRTKLMAASLPRSEVVISPLPEITVASSRFGKKVSQNQCNMSDISDSGAEDESVIRSVCSEFEPLPLEHCSKYKLPEALVTTTCKSSRKRSLNFACEPCSTQRIKVNDSGAVKRGHVPGVDLQPPRKRYQRVGLFSDFYKDEPKKRNENISRTQSPKVPSIRTDQSTTLMAPPIHFGKHFREMERDFQLPYDIWWQHTHDALPKKEAPRPKFKRIRNNVYVDVKPNTKKFEPHPCNCKRPTTPTDKGCLDDCLNRVVFTECTPETCPCGEQCSNQCIRRQDWAPALEKFVTEDRGFGVRTLKPVESNRIILEYLGEVVSEQEFRRRMTEEYSQDSHHYCLNMDGRTVIDGYRMGNITRFVNHSCEPNCEMQKWNVNGLCHMVLQTLREIKPYEEITYDYNFHSFNMEAQQACRCGSSVCRGVIGGKFQRNNNGQVGHPTLRFSRRASTTLSPPPLPPPPVGKGQMAAKQPSSAGTSFSRDAQEKKLQPHLVDYNFTRMVSPSMKPMSQRERLYARRHAIFLVRNIDRARGDRRHDETEKTEEQVTLDKVPDLLCMKDIINDHRSVKTRLGALADEKPELLRLHRLAVIFDEVYNAVATCRDEDGVIMAGPLMILPSRKRYPEYYKIVTEPIDLSNIRNNIKRGHYADIHSFDSDVQRLFRNVELYCGKRSKMGKVIARLRNVYQQARTLAIAKIEEVVGETISMLPSAAPSEADNAEAMESKVMPQVVGSDNEDVIRCICGIYRDEGIMIQCEKCMIWQHCDCVKVNPSDAGLEDVKYKCELCDPREVDREIRDPSKKEDTSGPDGETVYHYLSLMRDNKFQVSQGHCVYLMKDYKRPGRSSLRQSLLAASSPDKMDIFRIEELFKNVKGEKFCAGNLYLRPHETFHEPNRKFFHNELFRFPLYETYSLDQVAGKCFIMDLNTFSKGKPKGFDDKDIYICEFRVDKTAHLFSKISKKFPINTRSFCFDKHPQRIYPKRTYEPHEIPEEYLRRGGAGDKGSDKTCDSSSRKGMNSNPASVGNNDTCKVEAKTEEVDVKKVKADKKEGVCRFQMEEDKKLAKKERLNLLMLKILAAHGNSDTPKMDLSYLLDETLSKRPRKKPTAFY